MTRIETERRLQVFVISLKEAEKRRAQAHAQLSQLGIEYSFFNAIDGRRPLSEHFTEYDERAYLLNTGRVANSGEIGCFASHRSLWRLCVETNKPILILEDDFHLTHEFPAALTEVERLINQYGFIRLQTENRAKSLKVADVGHFVLNYYTKPPHSMMCYAIAPWVARTFVDMSAILSSPVDVFVKQFWRHGHLLYGLYPYTVTESRLSNDSLIGHRPKHRKTLALKLARLAYRIRARMRREIFLRSAPHPCRVEIDPAGEYANRS